MAKAATKIRGIALAPGVSKNGRLYTGENIGRAVARAQQRIAAGTMTMLTHHGAEDDSTHIVGRVTSMSQDESGAARFEAELAPTGNGKVIRKLVKGPQPFLKGVSIRGRWQGRVRTVNGAETADDLEIEGLDFTHRPGVPDARILAESAGGKAAGLIFEEAPAVTRAGKASSPAALLERGQRAFDAETVALRTLDEQALMSRLFESLGAGRQSPVWRETISPALIRESKSDKAAAAGPGALSVDDLARMSHDDFEAAAADYWNGRLAGLDAARPRSPFNRGLDGQSLA